ncbi:phosphotransferase family protein [Actinacidiphila soli]|uniref:phosphotransferase family protein n=1 Tax=Actinacidiphila soli TaxID=2487275 RepID=UPI000FCB0CA8|nr:aminoglycoside phosphotransferase family protein [Actinacidiphila soli]
MGTAVPLDHRSPQPPSCVAEAGKVSGDAYDRFVSHAMKYGELAGGHHNHNFLMPLLPHLAQQLGQQAQSLVKVRVPRPDALAVVPRTWKSESRILLKLRGKIPNLPSPLDPRRKPSVHLWVEGTALSERCPAGKAVDAYYIDALAGLFGVMTRLNRNDVPLLPPSWPRNGDSTGYLRRLARMTETRIRRPNWNRFGDLFEALGVGPSAMRDFAKVIPSMQRRPFGLLHTDLHRDNLIVTDDPDRPLYFLDWELASFGDPMHDLATHLVRMQYPDDQRDQVIEAWRNAVPVESAAGLETDLPHYLAFEHAQSVYPDVMRAARDLLNADGPDGMESAVRVVRDALLKAANPLRLRSIADEETTREALTAWHRSQLQGRPKRGLSVGWQRLQERLLGEQQSQGDEPGAVASGVAGLSAHSDQAQGQGADRAVLHGH